MKTEDRNGNERSELPSSEEGFLLSQLRGKEFFSFSFFFELRGRSLKTEVCIEQTTWTRCRSDEWKLFFYSFSNVCSLRFAAAVWFCESMVDVVACEARKHINHWHQNRVSAELCFLETNGWTNRFQGSSGAHSSNMCFSSPHPLARCDKISLLSHVNINKAYDFHIFIFSSFFLSFELV